MEEKIITDLPKTKNKYSTLRTLFKTLSFISAAVGIALGIYFGFDEVTTFDYYTQNVVTKTVFELWRAFIFWFTGISSALCLFAVSTVFNALNKKR
ncbi:MAG: hypothetical protein IJA13_04600 [Clostridia bacterium]|nr:hypothetical protein [Clostridia bacterium]MBQ3562807.1 hypothetical protein [Clostridia bacterium]